MLMPRQYDFKQTLDFMKDLDTYLTNIIERPDQAPPDFYKKLSTSVFYNQVLVLRRPNQILQ